jgi:ubiquinone/menaquinone biosynthesis C-methylase UbiE
MYSSINSDNQLHSLVSVCPDKVFALLTKSLRTVNTKKILDLIASTKEAYSSDTEIYKTIKELPREEKKQTIDTSSSVNWRAELRARDVCSILTSAKAQLDGNYLDFGGGDGEITLAVSNRLNINNKSTYCVDIEEWFDKDRSKNNMINHVLVSGDGSLPFSDSYFSFVSAFQSLHHVEELQLTLKELSRIVKKGGYLLIREHDCVNNVAKMLIDVEHALFERSCPEKEDDGSFQKSYYGEYRSKGEWSKLLQSVGFRYIPLYYPCINRYKNPTNYYYALYKKE